MCSDKIGTWTQNGLCGGGEGQTTRCKFMHKLEVLHQTLCLIVDLGQESNTALQSTRLNFITLGVLWFSVNWLAVLYLVLILRLDNGAG